MRRRELRSRLLRGVQLALLVREVPAEVVLLNREGHRDFGRVRGEGLRLLDGRPGPSERDPGIDPAIEAVNAPGIREPGVRGGESGIARERRLERFDRLLRGSAVEEEATLQVEVVGRRVTGRRGTRRRGLAEKPDAECARYRACDLVLNREDVVEGPVEALRPELVPARDVDELRGHAQLPLSLIHI